MLTEENFNSNDLLKSIKALPSHLIYPSPSRSAEDCVLCRGSGPAHLGDATADSRKTSFYLSCRRHTKKQECRGHSPLPGFGVSPKIPFYLSRRRRRPIIKTHRSIL